jgi:hypothetical protein
MEPWYTVTTARAEVREGRSFNPTNSPLSSNRSLRWITHKGLRRGAGLSGLTFCAEKHRPAGTRQRGIDDAAPAPRPQRKNKGFGETNQSRASQEPLAFADSGRYWHCLLVNGCGLREVGVQAVFQVAIVVMLKLFQVLFDKVESHNTKLELLRKPAKQWSFIPVFELVK